MITIDMRIRQAILPEERCECRVASTHGCFAPVFEAVVWYLLVWDFVERMGFEDMGVAKGIEDVKGGEGRGVDYLPICTSSFSRSTSLMFG